jgi:hypothetical protein
MKKLYIGGGFFIGIFFVAMAPLMALLMAWYAFDQKLWIAGLFAVGAAWFGWSSYQEFIAWYTIPPPKLLKLAGETIEAPGLIKQKAELKELHIGVLKTRKTVNFVPAGHDMTALVKLVFRDGTVLRFRAGQGPFTTFAPFGRNLGESEVEALASKVLLIRGGTGVMPKRGDISELFH